MTHAQHGFWAQFLGVVGATAFAVALVAFLSLPYCLGKHPGEVAPVPAKTEGYLR